GKRRPVRTGTERAFGRLLDQARRRRAGEVDLCRPGQENAGRQSADWWCQVRENTVGSRLDGLLTRFGPESLTSPAAAGEWTLFPGDAARNRSVSAGPPFPAPRWSHPASTDPRTQLALDRAARAHSLGSGTSLPLLSPLAVGDLILARTSRGVAAYDRDTGRCRWRVPSDGEGENSGLDGKLLQEAARRVLFAGLPCADVLQDG